MLSLLCYRSAGEGGKSLLASGVRAHDVLAAEAPALAQRLYEEAPIARHPAFDPDPAHYDVDSVFSLVDDQLRVRYPRYWMRRALDAGVGPVDDHLRAAYDHLDDVLARPESSAEISLEPGDALFINNIKVLHGRTAFRDAGDGASRTMLRALID
jgi:hypothetical protein